MNAKQRRQNRATAEWLKDQKVCQNCGKKGRHYLARQATLQDVIDGKWPSGQWICEGAKP